MTLAYRDLPSGRRYHYKNDSGATHAALYLHGNSDGGPNFGTNVVTQSPAGVLQVFPSATEWTDGNRRWISPGSENAQFYPTGTPTTVDRDYLEEVIADVETHFGVDVKYIAGFSGGGLMAIYMLNEGFIGGIAVSHTVGVRAEQWPIQFNTSQAFSWWFAPDDPNSTPPGAKTPQEAMDAAEVAYSAGSESQSQANCCGGGPNNRLTTFSYSGTSLLHRYKRKGGHAWVSCSSCSEEQTYEDAMG